MKIYKFRDLRDEDNDKFILPIILYNLIWCAKPSTLNDPKEFNFELEYRPTNRTLYLLSEVLTKFENKKSVMLPPALKALKVLEMGNLADITKPIIKEMIADCREEVGVSSFSTTNDDPWLWEEYGGFGNGLCIEFDILDELIEIEYHFVDYIDPNIFHVDLFLESAVDTNKVYPMYKKMLLTKTKKWQMEKEIRFLGKKNNIPFSISGRLSKIEFGINVSDVRFEEYYSKIKNHCDLNGVKIIRIQC